MQNLYSTFHRYRKLKNTAWVFLLATLFWATPGLGQQENISPLNKLEPIPWINESNPVFNVTATSGGNWNTGLLNPVNTTPRAVDSDTDNYAETSIGLGSSSWLRVTDANHKHSAGNYIGFLIETT